MNSRVISFFCNVAMIAVLCVIAGCGRSQPNLSATKPPEVIVTTPVSQSFVDYEEFTGRTEAVRTVDIRARVTGYLDRANFKDGADVKEGDLLLEIDPRTYQADVDRAAANLTQAQARMARLETDFQRAQSLLKTNALSQEEYDRIVGDRAEAAAAVRVAQAGLDTSKLNLAFTKVTSPVSGRISRMMIDPGNLVKADDTILTTIVTRDPIFAYFDVDERTMLRLRRLVHAGKIKSARESNISLELSLTDEDNFPHSGRMDFADNRLVANTGTLRVRGVFPNPQGLLSPGLFVRVRMPIGDPRQVMMIPEQALGTDQGQKYVFVVDDKNVVQYRRIKVGPQHDTLRVVEQGLEPSERFIVTGLQRVRAGVTVDPRMADKASAATSPQ